eukprot:CAMPEP_0201480856 /NCGR_PEP_ID=MMETSP0151_2-20130828/5245_1 /ASSEMBLY_ACC=CAM_ASM_000257 /TAXON_ID=200890 /ORGANISM="Paramoeba atlantica, Strain 621/1 / CCAP 1560/9" /LENGTH=42 /DNA_ID= /DNA_START= /DNA_END= /DNA_ORIENTATION=
MYDVVDKGFMAANAGHTQKEMWDRVRSKCEAMDSESALNDSD